MDKYKCWDCEKEIENVQLSDEVKEKCPRGFDGTYFLICNECKDNDY